MNRAEDILRQLVAIPFVSAAPDGTIQFEFADDHGYLELEIPGSGRIRMIRTTGENADGWQEMAIEDTDVPGNCTGFLYRTTLTAGQ